MKGKMMNNFHHWILFCNFSSSQFLSFFITGLGFFSEQSVESIHSDWKGFWESYKVPEDHPKYLEQLFLAVIAYNAKHL